MHTTYIHSKKVWFTPCKPSERMRETLNNSSKWCVACFSYVPAYLERTPAFAIYGKTNHLSSNYVNEMFEIYNKRDLFGKFELQKLSSQSITWLQVDDLRSDLVQMFNACLATFAAASFCSQLLFFFLILVWNLPSLLFSSTSVHDHNQRISHFLSMFQTCLTRKKQKKRRRNWFGFCFSQLRLINKFKVY